MVWHRVRQKLYFLLQDMTLTDAKTEQCQTYVTSTRKGRCNTDSQMQPAVWREDEIVCQQVSFYFCFSNDDNTAALWHPYFHFLCFLSSFILLHIL